MTSIQTQLVINAPPSKVYSVLMDFAKYPLWNPMVQSISGDTSVGSKLDLSIKIGDRPPKTYTPVVLSNEQDNEFSWGGTVIAKFIHHGQHYFRLTPIQDATLFTHGEQFSGLFARPFDAAFAADLQSSIHAYNSAFKAYIESE